MHISGRKDRYTSGGRYRGGYSLIEVMVALGVVALLAAIVIPGYQVLSRDSKRDDAQRLLSELAARQEQFRLGNRTYTQIIGVGGLNFDTSTTQNAYILSVATPTPLCVITGCYVVVATPQGTQVNHRCKTLGYASSGLKTPANCWR
jgi:type IV pilus assembly protein PilE